MNAVAARHHVQLSDADVETLERAAQSHALVLRAAAEFTRVDRGDTSATSMEADRLAHVTSLVQPHVHGHCDCPISTGGPH